MPWAISFYTTVGTMLVINLKVKKRQANLIFWRCNHQSNDRLPTIR